MCVTLYKDMALQRIVMYMRIKNTLGVKKVQGQSEAAV